MPENLQSDVVKVTRTSRKTSLTLMHENENILVQFLFSLVQSQRNYQNSLSPSKIREEIWQSRLQKFKTKLKNYLFDKTLAKNISCS